MSNVEPINSFEKIGDAANRVVENIRPFPSCPYDGSKISTPGIYDAVPMTAYHGDLCDGPSVSSSGLRLIEAKTPAHYYATSYLNPNRIEQDEKDAFDFGRAAHSLLLGESGFFKQFAVRPEAFKDYRTKAAQEWRDSTRAEGLTPLTSDDLAAIKAIAANLDTHPLARDLLRGHIEQSLVFKDSQPDRMENMAGPSDGGDHVTASTLPDHAGANPGTSTGQAGERPSPVSNSSQPTSSPAETDKPASEPNPSAPDAGTNSESSGGSLTDDGVQAGAGPDKPGAGLPAGWQTTYVKAMNAASDRPKSLPTRHTEALKTIGGEPSEADLEEMRAIYALRQRNLKGEISADDYQSMLREIVGDVE